MCIRDSPLTQTLKALATASKQGQVDPNHLAQTLSKLHINLVLTAHPTEVTRRTMINKHVELSDCLASLERKDNLPSERADLLNRIAQLISQAWHTDDIRRSRPTPINEAKWGFAVIENSLWHAVPRFLREFGEDVKEELDLELPIDFSPIEFTSWMGGDRDGNPFVTACLVGSEMCIRDRLISWAMRFNKSARSLGKLSLRSKEARQSLNSTCLLIIVRRVTSVG